MTTSKARAVLLTIEIHDPVEHDELLVRYAGLEKDGFLYLINPRDISEYAEPSAYYKLAIKDIPNYDFDDDWNTMYAKHLPAPVSIDAELRSEIKACAKLMKKRYKLSVCD